MLQNATHLRKSVPWPPNISDEHVSCIAPVTRNASFQISFTCPTPAIVFGILQNSHVLLGAESFAGVFCKFWLPNVLRATRVCTFSTSQLPKVVWEWCALYILTWKYASRHNVVHFFDITTSKSRPTLRCFVHFDFEICFAPQRHAILHLSSGQLAPHPPL